MSSDSLYDCLACAPQLLGMLEQYPQLTELWQSLPRQSYGANQTVLRPGQLSDRCWFVVSGLLRCGGERRTGDSRGQKGSDQGGHDDFLS